MVKLSSISKRKSTSERGQGLRRSVGWSVSCLVALQAGCQRNAGSTAKPLKQTTRGRKVKSAKFVAKIVLFFFFLSFFCQNFSLLQSRPVILQHTGLKMQTSKEALGTCYHAVLKNL